MIWRALARTVATVHVAYSAFVALGSIVVLLWPRLMWVHLLAVAWAGMTLILDCGCPLTPWEKRFWRKGGVEPYEEGFLQHHVLRTRFDPARSRRNHVVIGAAALGFNALIYSLIVLRR